MLLAGCGGGSPVDWAIVDSGPDGEELIIVPLVGLRSCDGQPKVDVRKSNANRIDVGVTLDRGSCEGEEARPAEPISVRLQHPPRGQQIGGPGKRPPSANPRARTAAAMPSVVGFRLPDARAILAARGLEVGSIVGPTVAATEVTTQSPTAGTPLPADAQAALPRVALRTVPR